MSIELIRGDCLVEMPKLTKRGIFVDTCVTDPPFNAGKRFANDNHTAQGFKDFCAAFAGTLAHLAPKNILVEVGKDDATMRTELDKRFQYRYAICLNYTNSMRNGAIGFSNFGLVLWYSNGGKCHQRYKDRLDSILHDTRHLFDHESPKEVDHYKHLVRMFTPEGGTVVDPFMGSGTTGVACVIEKRNFIGIESDEYYFKVASARISRAQGFPADMPKRVVNRDCPLFDRDIEQGGENHGLIVIPDRPTN